LSAAKDTGSIAVQIL